MDFVMHLIRAGWRQAEGRGESEEEREERNTYLASLWAANCPKLCYRVAEPKGGAKKNTGRFRSFLVD